MGTLRNQVGYLAKIALVATVASRAGADDKPAPAPENKLAALERFVGGQWVVHGKWSTGEELRARSVYEWGLGKKIITAKTYVMNGDTEYQRYEGILAYHPKKKCLFEISFAFNGDVSEVLVESKDKDTLHIGWSPFTEGDQQNVRQIIKFTNKESFVWTVRVKSGDEWKQLIEATWHRKEK